MMYMNVLMEFDTMEESCVVLLTSKRLSYVIKFNWRRDVTKCAVASPITSLSVVRPVDQRLQFKKPVKQCLQFNKNVWSGPVGLKPLRLQYHPVQGSSISSASRAKHASVICAAALNANMCCRATQTVNTSIIYHYCCTYPRKRKVPRT
ncbi:hypothetical protein Salat_2036700 [Sesamum alatum]|uniref:Uncharacterized protein n=1 Tax=Sesamum alatum TaxID=300844 RepID=A0AAE1XZM5_9LAMI|nr:hypothetical protein Salat_2036700 [Sesamum alatum]